MNWRFESAVPGIAWPALPQPPHSLTLALLHQLEQSQWLAPERIESEQFRQLAPLLRHAWETVPHYRDAWGGAFDASAPARESFLRLPTLSRRALQEHRESLQSRAIPPSHGRVFEFRTSGSTGEPVRVLKSEIGAVFWNALTLRDHLWHRRLLERKLAAVRQHATPGEAPSWGAATDGLVATGPCVLLNISSDVEAQLDWLVKHDPAYLLTYPSNVAALARASLARGLRLGGLLEVRTLGESVPAGLRVLCKEAWDVPLVDLYSSHEVGYIALQCPQHEHYHVQSESVLVEVLDEHGGACRPGEVGRVIVTDLHNFTMPLLRYEIGDYAIAGAPCPCGRGLATLTRILGRVRNMLTHADGRRYWPTFGQDGFRDIAPVLQYQFVQRVRETLEARLVLAEPLNENQESRLKERIAAQLPPGLRIELVRVESLPRGPGGKFEEFVCEVAES
jgi:phenylacetate-CoA ligase